MLPALPLRHFLLAVVVAAVWGTNFVVIKVALEHLPPFLFATLRFTLALLPAALFLRPPPVPWRNMATYGVLIGVGQFGVMYYAMQSDITPGMASLVVQTQAFFTIGLAMLITRERLRAFQWLALLLAAAGIGAILFHTDGSTTRLGLALTLVAALSWGGGNIASRQAGTVNMLAYVVWSSLFAIPPLLVLSIVFEGPDAIATSVVQADIATWLAVAWQAWGNTLFGYGAWAWLLSRHPAITVAPIALLVPLFGMAASALYLGEPLPAWKLSAAGLVMAGLAVNLLWPLWRGRRGHESR